MVSLWMDVFVSEEISPRKLNQRGHLTKTYAMNLSCVFVCKLL